MSGEFDAGPKPDSSGDDELTYQEIWDRYWSIARYTLGLSDADFFALTPRQIHLLLERWNDQVEHDEFMVAQLCQTILAPYAKQVPLADTFMPSRQRKLIQNEKTAADLAKLNRRICILFENHNKQFLAS